VNVLLFEYMNWMIFDIVLLLTLGLITKETKYCFIYQNYSEVSILRFESKYKEKYYNKTRRRKSTANL